jgi:hypothetical protein
MAKQLSGATEKKAGESIYGVTVQILSSQNNL